MHSSVNYIKSILGSQRHLAVCYIWQSPFMMTRSAESLLALDRPDGWKVSVHRGTGWGPACRHIDACEKALKAGADWILILGADQVYESDLLCRITARLAEGYETCAALVPTRGFVATNEGMRPFQRMAWRFKPSMDGLAMRPRLYRGQVLDRDMIEIIDPDAGEMQSVTCIGSGVLCFHRDHLLALKKPYFYESIDQETQQRHASMDTTFTFRLGAEAGATIWVDTSIRVRHLHLFAIDPSFETRFADWSVPTPSTDLDICRYLPTAMPNSTLADAQEQSPFMPPRLQTATLPVAFFDNYRANYATMSFAEHQRMYSIIERVYPSQSCYNRDGATAFFAALCCHGVAPNVLELGGWKGELAQEMLTQFPGISHWYNIDICREAATVARSVRGRYAATTLDDFFWNYKPTYVRMCNTLVLSHVVEHMRLQDFAATIAHCADQGITYVYLDIPHIQEHTVKNWRGWPNTHIFEGTWTDIDAVMTAHGYANMSLSQDTATLTPRMYASPQGVCVLQKQEQGAYASA